MDYLEMSPEYAACQGPVEDDEDPYLASLTAEEEREYYEWLMEPLTVDCPKDGTQGVKSTTTTGGSDPYAVDLLKCGHQVADFGDGPVIL